MRSHAWQERASGASPLGAHECQSAFLRQCSLALRSFIADQDGGWPKRTHLGDEPRRRGQEPVANSQRWGSASKLRGGTQRRNPVEGLSTATPSGGATQGWRRRPPLMAATELLPLLPAPVACPCRPGRAHRALVSPCSRASMARRAARTSPTSRSCGTAGRWPVPHRAPSSGLRHPDQPQGTLAAPTVRHCEG
jgi:hypothetical protein